jgi:two-component system sensor histidine kinase/response regulator
MSAFSSEFVSEYNEIPHLVAGEKGDAKFAEAHPLRILIAEDNYTNRRLLIFLLKSLGYKADATENGQECLVAALEKSYDILLSDIDMPEMNGLECATQIRSAGLEFPIIALTASFPEVTPEECFQAGMNGYMRKPVNVTELKRILRETALRKWIDQSNRAVAAVAA